MGAVLTPSLIGVDKAGHLPNASTFCGRCESVCPVRIPLPKMMRHWREREFERHLTPPAERSGLGVWAFFAKRGRALPAGEPARRRACLRLLGRGRGRFALAAARRRLDRAARPAGAGRRHLPGRLETARQGTPEGRPMSDSESAPTLKPINRPPRATSRDRVLGALRHALDAAAFEELRRDVVASRLASHPRGPIPARGQIDRAGRLALFRDQAIRGRRHGRAAGEPRRGARRHQRRAARPQSAAAGARWAPTRGLPPCPGTPSRRWRSGLAPPTAATSPRVSFAFAAVAESGTLVLLSGPNNPTTLNFLPDTHIVVLAADDVAGDYETVWDALRAHYGPW